MSEPSLKLLSASDFNPEKYVRQLSHNCIGGTELVRLRNKIQILSEETSGDLKKNVYQNYMQFIDTAKEISHLESEMYQLSHLLSEQRALLSSLSNTSILGDEAPIIIDTSNKDSTDEQKEEARQNKLASISENVEGCIPLVEIAVRSLIHEGDFLELDIVESTPVKRIHGYLFNDGLMLAAWNANRRGPVRYKFEAFYELGSLAVVNVKDLGNVKYAFKLLAFPDTKLFQSSTNMSKKEWLEKFDGAKKSRLAQDKSKRETILEKAPSRTSSIDSPSLNPFDDPVEEIAIHPTWFLEASEELDVLIAQRHFEDALNLLQKCKDYFSTYVIPNKTLPDHAFSEIKRKVEQKQTILVDVLIKELEVTPDKSLQGGLRAARRAVRLLNQLDRSMESCNLFLKLCSSMLRIQCKRVKREGSAIIYIRHLSSVVFTNMCHMAEEFLRAFPESPNCSSAFVVWASSELNLFATHFIKQVFIPQTSLKTLTECVTMSRMQCERLCSYGIDLCYQLDGAFRNPLMKALRDARDKQIDAIKVRSTDDKWIPTNLKSKLGLARYLQEHADTGLTLDTYITGDCWLQLTSNTLSFTKLFLALLDDCLKLQTSELLYTINETLFEVCEAQIKYIGQSLRSENQSEQRQFITKNADFILVSLMELAQKKYTAAVGFSCSSLTRLVKEHEALIHGITPTNRQITKYSSNEYL